MRIHSPLCSLFGIETPIVQAPVGRAASPELAAAVSEAGGLGMLELSRHDDREMRELIHRVQHLTDRPFGVNLTLDWPQRRRLEDCLAEGVRVISTFWGDPRPFVPSIHNAGARLIHAVGSVEEARRAADAGADAIVAQGIEAGGPVRGSVSTFTLVPATVDAVPDRPILAAGGIGDGRGIAAAMLLGASGVWLGTRFLCTDEAAVSHLYQQAILLAGTDDTTLTTLFDKGWPGVPHRVLRTPTVRRWQDEGRPGPGTRPGEADIVAFFQDGTPIERYSDVMPSSDITGDLTALPFYAGQSAAVIHDIRPAADVLRSLTEEASRLLHEASIRPSDDRRPPPSTDRMLHRFSQRSAREILETGS